ncbi:MAG: hypothetical protein IRZ16_03780 [Myxococcaceae bacterium]|nr:hypothetical protein [Myxococcaceae bacterium]
MISEDLDLKQLAEELRTQLLHDPPHGYLRGRTLMRDILVHDHKFSELEAEELIDTMELNGFLHFLGDPAERSHASDTTWEIG